MKKFKVKMLKDIPKFIKVEELLNEKGRKDNYMNVCIFDTFDEMYEYVDKHGGYQEHNYLARTYTELKTFVSVKTDELVNYSPFCGELYFVKGNIYHDTVSHEATHAVLGYFNRRIENYKGIFDDSIFGLETSSTSGVLEELFCYMVGNLTSTICDTYLDMIGE